MKLLAKTSTYHNSTFIQGPEYNDKDEMLSPGQTVTVRDDFVVNPEVWDVVEKPAGGKPVKYSKKPEGAAAEPTTGGATS